MRCERCGDEVALEEIYQVQGQQLCEDCAMASQKGPKACDVWQYASPPIPGAL